MFVNRRLFSATDVTTICYRDIFTPRLLLSYKNNGYQIEIQQSPLWLVSKSATHTQQGPRDPRSQTFRTRQKGLHVGDLTWSICDQTVLTLRLHLNVCTAGRQRQHVRPVCGLTDLLPETPAFQRTSYQTAAGKQAGRRPGNVAQRRHGTPGLMVLH